MALKDQLLALKWFHENAAAFGADRDRITVQGHSSGGAMAHFLTLVPATQPYFQRSILMSGVAINHWAMSPNTAQDHLRDMFQLGEPFRIRNQIRLMLTLFTAHDLNQTFETKHELVAILQNISSDVLVRHTFTSLYVPGLPERRPNLRWTPTIESEL